MAGGGSSESVRQLDQTPTWAVASVCAVIIIISIILEKVLHRLGEWFTRRHKKALFDALEKVKAELMILGFISLLLTFGQSYIARICISEKIADNMLPCALKQSTETSSETDSEEENHRRRLLEVVLANFSPQRRILAGAGSSGSCSKGKVPLVSTDGIHQLHIFIFFLAVFHVVYSAATMALGRLKIRRWKDWERETSSLHYEFSNDPARFRFAHETSFVKAHSNWWTRTSVSFYVISFFRQFFRSVRKADYLTMRHAFINVHLAPGSKFDFQKYIKRSMEDDFKVIVGISPPLWASAVIFLLLSVHSWQTLFWLSILPVVIILAVGTKLQAIIAKMAIEIKERHAVVQGMPVAQLGDIHFWFNSPNLVLFLIHYSLFQNAFEIIHFVWIWYEFGLKSCFHENFGFIIARVVIGVGVLFMCSYITLPLYALVSQMGSRMKKSIFDEQTAKALKNWRMAVKKKRGIRTPTSGRSPAISPSQSPVHSLQRFKTTGHLGFGSSTVPKSSYYSDQDLSDMEGDGTTSPTSSQTAVLIENMEGQEGVTEYISNEEVHEEDDFSFVRPAPAAVVRPAPLGNDH